MVSNARVGKSNVLVDSFSGELGRSKEIDEKCCQLIRDNLRWAAALNYPHCVPPRPCLFGDIHKLNIPDLYCSGTSYNQKKRKTINTLLVQRQECGIHRGFQRGSCRIPWSPDYCCSGLPREDMSNSVYMSHGKFCQQRDVKLVTLECTKDA